MNISENKQLFLKGIVTDTDGKKSIHFAVVNLHDDFEFTEENLEKVRRGFIENCIQQSNGGSCIATFHASEDKISGKNNSETPSLTYQELANFFYAKNKKRID